jgi:hypothetical protein
MVIVSERWMDPVAERFAGGGTRPTALIDRLRAPSGARAVAAWRPAPGGPSPVIDAVGWVRDERVDAVLRIARPDAAAATRARVGGWLDSLAGAMKAACAEDPGAVIDEVSVAGEGAAVRIRATLHTDRLLAYLRCLGVSGAAPPPP